MIIMPKRRRSSFASSRGGDDDSQDSEPSTSSELSRKRRKYDPLDLCQQLYDIVRSHKKEDATLLCDSFIRVPKRRQEPSYYEVVTHPIDLLKIQQKLKTEEYEDVEQLTADMDLMVTNAKSFYKRSSQEHRDACDLWELYAEARNRIIAEESAVDDGEPKAKIILKVGKLVKRAAVAELYRAGEADDGSETSSTTAEDESCTPYEELFTAVMLAQDVDGRPLHTAFQLLPSKKLYPEYYEVIDKPIDLKMIAMKIQCNEFTCVSELERDLMLVVKNACAFNEPGSQIYKDAKLLKKIISGRKMEIEHGRITPGKSSERIRNKRLRGSQTMSAITAALQYEDDLHGGMNVKNVGGGRRGGGLIVEEEEEEEGEEMEGEGGDSPQWQLYDAVRSHTNTQGVVLSEPFLKLPSKRYYADYYKEIKNAISLTQICSKLQRGNYGNVSELAGDMNIMFENAKTYNRPESQLYKDAVKLQKVMQKKVQELFDEQGSESEEEGNWRRKPKAKWRTRDPPNKKRFQALYRSLIEYVHEDGRQPILMFMEKPSKKTYPDYYKVISEPIDMLTIDANIKNDRYQAEEELLRDLKIMFDNCRQYNEEGSIIYEDANTLEQVLMEKVKDLSSPCDNVKKMYKKYRIKASSCPLSEKLRTLFDTIRDYKDPKGRQLSLIFLKLPSKSEYPDYYEVINKPIDVEKIHQKLKTSSYESLEELLSDFILMFDNGCKYNEPDSQIYKDALILQRVALQTKLSLNEDDDSLPDVHMALQELLTSLFITVYNHQDEEGRCFSDSMAELPEHDDIKGKKVRAVSFDMIKRRLDKGLYKRLDRFQEDMFSCFDRARRLSRTDSQVFEDSIEMQSFFIKQRDELCQEGALLESTCLSFTVESLLQCVEGLRQVKQAGEQPEEETEDTKQSTPVVGPAMAYNQQVFNVGDFVYIEPKERGMEPHLYYIERLWTNQEGQHMLYGVAFYRPNETYHVQTRKFLEKEVFRTEFHAAIPLGQVVGKCCVLNVKDYFHLRVEGLPEKDVYVCESRYSCRNRSFKKIKVWPCEIPAYVQTFQRPEPMEPKRVMSVFRERVEKHKEEIAELEEGEGVGEKERCNVIISNPEGTEGNVYYEQYSLSVFAIKTGDSVYLKGDADRKPIALVDTIWTTTEGNCYFRGPRLVSPSVIAHTPTRMFYKNEVFLSNLEETYALESIEGRCFVMDYDRYISCRPTDIAENDVYVCESQYDETKVMVTPLMKGARKKYDHGAATTKDEIYYFRRSIIPQKIEYEPPKPPPQTKILMECAPSPLLPKLPLDEVMDDSLDGPPPSTGSGEMPAVSQALSITPVSTKKGKSVGKKLVTGYILYSSDVRKGVIGKNPDSSFGEISRIVGNEWRNLPIPEKQIWEEKAAKINEENAAKFAAAEIAAADSPNPSLGNPGGGDSVYECGWEQCDFQFEDLSDFLEHCVADSNGHVYQYYTGSPEVGEFQCQWRVCGRVKKGVAPFPNILRLVRHVKEVHINKGVPKAIPMDQRGRNFVPSKRAIAKTVNSATNPSGLSLSGMGQPIQNTGGAASQNSAPSPPPAEPLFVTVPPRPQRLLHSEAYIKYIESLQPEGRHMTNWENQLKATPDSTPAPDAEKLPSHWLANGIGNHGSALNALWALRDFMLRDALSLSKN